MTKKPLPRGWGWGVIWYVWEKDIVLWSCDGSAWSAWTCPFYVQKLKDCDERSRFNLLTREHLPRWILPWWASLSMATPKPCRYLFNFYLFLFVINIIFLFPFFSHFIFILINILFVLRFTLNFNIESTNYKLQY